MASALRRFRDPRVAAVEVPSPSPVVPNHPASNAAKCSGAAGRGIASYDASKEASQRLDSARDLSWSYSIGSVIRGRAGRWPVMWGLGYEALDAERGTETAVVGVDTVELLTQDVLDREAVLEVEGRGLVEVNRSENAGLVF